MRNLFPSLSSLTPKASIEFREASMSLDKLSISKIELPLARPAQNIALWA